MRLSELPLLTALGDARSVLIAGAGGGFDVYSGLPLFAALRAQGRRVHLANLSFTTLERTTGTVVAPALVRIDEHTDGPAHYFPEGHLARFLAARGMPTPVHCFARGGVQPLVEAYRVLRETLELDAVILVDGGTDSLMRGDEDGLGTPQEDSASIVAANALGLPRSFLACVGFGVDHYHGVSHHDVLRATSELAAHGAFLGAFSLLRDMPEVQLFLDAVEHAHACQPGAPSIVCSSIQSAVEGLFGDVHRTLRTEASTLFINPLMSLCFAYKLQAVAGRLLYADRILPTRTWQELVDAIRMFRATVVKRPVHPIPL